MQIFLNQLFTPQNNVVSQKAVGKANTANVYTVQGKTFQYKVYTDTNDNITKVVAFSPRKLAPADYFIQNVNTCTKKLIVCVACFQIVHLFWKVGLLILEQQDMVLLRLVYPKW